MSLAGQTVLVTRPRGQAAALVEPLEALGARVFALPAIEIVPPESFEELDAALCDLDRSDWLVLTSVNGVAAVKERFDALGLRNAFGTRIAAIGPATAEAATKAFKAPDLVPDEYVSEAIAEAMGEVRGKRILLARADIARKELANILRERGAIVEEVTAYRIVAPDGAVELPESAPDIITLTSSSAARGTLEILRREGKEAWMSEARLACIGPITASTVRELGYEVAVMADEYTVPGLVKALEGGDVA